MESAGREPAGKEERPIYASVGLFGKNRSRRGWKNSR
jgi:hypothetical protein